MFSKIKSPYFYRFLATLTTLAGLGLFFLAWTSFQSAEPLHGRQWGIVVVGSVFLLFGFMFPVRIVRIGAQLPLEISSNVKILAFCLPIGGCALVVAGAVPIPKVQAGAYAVAGLCACYSALFGFLRLSFSLPKTFYMGEMVSIFLSTGVWGKKEESNADIAFTRWTQGRVTGVPEGQAAPDGDVVTFEGETRKLSSYFEGEGDFSPLVLNFGSYSCPHHRKRVEELREVVQRWEPRGVRFLTVYITEAHPEDGWRLENQYAHDDEFNGDQDNFCFFYAKTLDDRKFMAQWMKDKKDFPTPMVLDSIEDTLLTAYNSWPIRLYIIDKGEVIFSGKQGPFGYAPSDLNPVLERLQREQVSVRTKLAA